MYFKYKVKYIIILNYLNCVILSTELTRLESNSNSNKAENFKNPNKESKNINGDLREIKQAIIDEKHNPLVKLTIEKDDKKLNYLNSNKVLLNNEINYYNNEDSDLVNNAIKNINNEKKVISKQVEVVTKILYTYEDGSTREVVEKNNHTYNY